MYEDGEEVQYFPIFRFAGQKKACREGGRRLKTGAQVQKRTRRDRSSSVTVCDCLQWLPVFLGGRVEICSGVTPPARPGEEKKH